MRIRNKPWAKVELAQSEFFVMEPEKFKGRWREFFKNDRNPIHLELGCGKGFFVKKAAKDNPEINFIAVDLIDAILGMANRNIIEEFENKDVPKSYSKAIKDIWLNSVNAYTEDIIDDEWYTKPNNVIAIPMNPKTGKYDVKSKELFYFVDGTQSPYIN